MGNNFEKKVDSMASHSGYSTKDGSIAQLAIENSGLPAGDACLIFMSMMDFSVLWADLVLSSNMLWAKGINGFNNLKNYGFGWEHKG